MFSEEIKALINEIESFERIIILCHQNADPDAIGSAYALSYLLKKNFPHIENVIVSESLNKLSKRIVDKFKFKILDDIVLKKTDILIMVDTNNLDQLGKIGKEIKKLDNPTIVSIDHHLIHPQTTEIAKLCIIDDNRSSTSEIIFLMYKGCNIVIPRSVAFLLLAGITYDSRHFLIANLDTFRIAALLLETGIDYDEILEILRLPMDSSESIARLKAAQRLKIYKIEGWIVVTSHVGAFEASAARSILNLGADISIVLSEDAKKNIVRISARAKPSVCKATKLHLGKVMEKIGTIIDGVGGGHQTAAACNGKKNGEKGIKRILKDIEEILIKNPKEE